MERGGGVIEKYEMKFKFQMIMLFSLQLTKADYEEKAE